MEERSDVLVLFKVLNDRSAVQLVTGSVAKMVRRTFMFGYMVDVCGRVFLGQSGRLVRPWFLECSCHFTSQISHSLLKESGDGRSALYNSASLEQLFMNK